MFFVILIEDLVPSILRNVASYLELNPSFLRHEEASFSLSFGLNGSGFRWHECYRELGRKFKILARLFL